ncbi:MAG: hypothetical protein HAW62_01180 [Endozoicomonadaceae bacterium]|nr:hypothetical protein [Endozoicomonadaceae bacterium]
MSQHKTSTVSHNAESNQSKVKKKEGIKRWCYVSGLSLVSSLLALGFSLWVWNNCHDQEQKMILYQSAFDYQKENQQKIQHQANQANQAIQSMQDKQNMQMNQLEQIMHQIVNISRPYHWQVIDMKYILHLAQWQLRAMHHIEGARALLQLLREMLVELGSMDVTLIQKGLKQDEQILNAIDTIDYGLLWSDLNQIKADLLQLPRLILQDFKPIVAPVISHDDKTSSSVMQGMILFFQNSWEFFKSQFKFEKTDNAFIHQILSKQEEVMIRQMISSLIVQAQQAMILRDQQVYEHCLTQVVELIHRYFYDMDNHQALLERIHSLKAYRLQPDSPELLHTMEALQRYENK